MTTERSERTLRAFQERTPFHPFTVALVSGHRFQVDHPEARVLRGGVAVLIDKGGAPTLFNHESVGPFVGEPLPSESASN